MPRIYRKTGEEYVDNTLHTSEFTTTVERVYRLDASGGAFNVHLPTASGIGGQDIILYAEYDHANNLTVVPSGSETIAGSGNLTLSQREAVSLTSNGISDWFRIGPS